MHSHIIPALFCEYNQFLFFKKYFFLLGSLTRNSSTDLTDFKTRNEKRKVYNALAAASIFKNSAGVDTSRRQVVPMDAFLQFLTMFQKENLTEVEARALIEVSFSTTLITRKILAPFSIHTLSFFGRKYDIRAKNNSMGEIPKNSCGFFSSNQHPLLLFLV